MRPDGVLFDLDGTLWDNTANAAEAWARALCSVPEHPPAPTQEDIRACCGYALPELAERLVPSLPPQRAMEIVQECYKLEGPVTRERGGILYAGVEQMLRTPMPWPSASVTGSPFRNRTSGPQVLDTCKKNLPLFS